MARLTQATLKYMGATKDSVLPSPDTVQQYGFDLQKMSNDFYSAFTKWKKETDINRLKPLLAEYSPDLPRDIYSIIEKFDDLDTIIGTVVDGFTDVAKQLQSNARTSSMSDQDLLNDKGG